MQIERIENIPIEDVDNDGIINLMSALLIQARQDYELSLNYCDPISARNKADYDARGIVGYIVGYVTGDKYFFAKEVDRRIDEERRKHGIK